MYIAIIDVFIYSIQMHSCKSV